jgi:alpha-tubulin suppressor-like RCC1 family protein
VLRSGGRVECWGANESGQLGDGTRRYSRVPVAVNGISGARAVSVDPRGYSCAALTDGHVYCWGHNPKDQLGDGRQPRGSLVPAAALGVSDALSVSTAQGHACALLASGGADCWGSDDYGQLGIDSAQAIANPSAVLLP